MQLRHAMYNYGLLYIHVYTCTCTCMKKMKLKAVWEMSCHTCTCIYRHVCFMNAALVASGVSLHDVCDIEQKQTLNSCKR